MFTLSLNRKGSLLLKRIIAFVKMIFMQLIAPMINVYFYIPEQPKYDQYNVTHKGCFFKFSYDFMNLSEPIRSVFSSITLK